MYCPLGGPSPQAASEQLENSTRIDSVGQTVRGTEGIEVETRGNEPIVEKVEYEIFLEWLAPEENRAI